MKDINKRIVAIQCELESSAAEKLKKAEARA